MSIVYPNLNRQLCDAGVSLEVLSDATDIDLDSLKQKVRGTLPFSLEDAVRICLYLNYPDAKHLFSN